MNMLRTIINIHAVLGHPTPPEVIEACDHVWDTLTALIKEYEALRAKYDALEAMHDHELFQVRGES